MPTNRQAKIVLVNKTGCPMFFNVRHCYTGVKETSSGIIQFSPGQKKEIMNVAYRTGFLTTGVDNFIVEGRLPNGQCYTSGHGFAAAWKKHTLRDEDADKVTCIEVEAKKVSFKSPSGNSSTGFYKEKRVVPFADTGHGEWFENAVLFLAKEGAKLAAEEIGIPIP